MTRHSRQQPFKIYSESDHSYIQAATNRILALSGHLRLHGIHAHYPFPIMMGVHSMQLPPNSDVKALQLLIDHWAEAQAALAAPATPELSAGTASRSTMVGR